MTEEQRIKEQCLQMAQSDIKMLFTIIGEMGYVGYKISMCRLKGMSYRQCGMKFGISKTRAQKYWRKCREKGYDAHLMRLFNL